MQHAGAGAQQVGAAQAGGQQVGAGAQQVGAAGGQQDGAGAQQEFPPQLEPHPPFLCFFINLRNHPPQRRFLLPQQDGAGAQQESGAQQVGATGGAQTGAQQVGSGAQQLGAGVSQHDVSQQLDFLCFLKNPNPASALVELRQQAANVTVTIIHFISTSPLKFLQNRGRQ